MTGFNELLALVEQAGGTWQGTAAELLALVPNAAPDATRLSKLLDRLPGLVVERQRESGTGKRVVVLRLACDAGHVAGVTNNRARGMTQSGNSRAREEAHGQTTAALAQWSAEAVEQLDVPPAVTLPDAAGIVLSRNSVWGDARIPPEPGAFCGACGGRRWWCHADGRGASRCVRCCDPEAAGVAALCEAGS